MFRAERGPSAGQVFARNLSWTLRQLISSLYNSSRTRRNFKMPSTHNGEKPWDTEDIDKWKVHLAHLLGATDNMR